MSDSSRKFHFIREIARGGFGAVYLAKVIHADGFSRLVAVKLLHPKWSEDVEIASRMRDEARLLGWLRHKNIVDVIDLTRIDGRVAVVMEYLEAVDTRLVIKNCMKNDDILPMRVALEMCSQTASALDAAYNRPPYAGERPLRVIHRDIKPSNIMIDSDGVTKVLDFGVARADFDSRESHTEEMSFGSLEYMPPERLFFEPDTPASDVYSLGATLFELLTLEKFGKSRLTPGEHEQYIYSRLERLLEVQLFDDAELGEELLLLLTEMLAFDEKERPTASQCVLRMRQLSRRFTAQPAVVEWAEEEIPPLVEAFLAIEKTNSELVGRVYEEDASRSFKHDLTEETAPKPNNSDNRSRVFEDVEDEPTDPAGEDTAVELAMADPAREARWEALKEQTLKDIADDAPPAAPSRGGAAAGPGMSVGDDTTAVQRAPHGDPDTLPRKPTPRSSIEPPREVTDPTMEKIDPVTEEELAAHDASKPSARPVVSRTPVAPERAPANDEQPAEEGWLGAVLMLTVGMLLIAALATGGLAIIGGVVGYSVMDEVPALATTTAPSPVQPEAAAPSEEAAGTDASEPTDTVPAEPEVAAVPEGPATHFVSRIGDPKKMTIRCDNGEGKGVGDAWVEGEELGTCAVMGMAMDRSRLTAVVENPEPREYICFEGGEKSCE